MIPGEPAQGRPGERPISIGIVGDFDPTFPPHAATNAALRHSADLLGIALEVSWLETQSLAGDDPDRILAYQALWCAPGSPYRSLDGAVRAIRVARQDGVPFLGTCGGFQHVVIEYAGNVLDVEDAQHAEYDPYASKLFVSELSCSLVGKKMEVRLMGGSRAARSYGSTETTEEYYCNFGLNPDYQDLLHEGGLRVVGTDQDGEARVLELPGHRFFVATLFVPQLRSSPRSPHPLITAYLRAAVHFSEQLEALSRRPGLA